MKSKPLSVTIIALLYFLEPLAGLAIAARVNHLPLWGSGGIVAHLSLSNWLALSLFPLAAAGIYSVRRWGWYLFVTSSTLLVSYNFWILFFANAHYGTRLGAFFIVSVAGLCAVVFRRHLYSPYFNPRLRWWETAARYRVNLAVRLFTQNGEADAETLADISATGCFIKMSHALEIGIRVWVVISCAGTEMSFIGRVVRKGDENGYGIMFGAMTTETRRYLNRLIRALEHLGGRDREGHVPVSRIPADYYGIRFDTLLGPAMMRLLRPIAPFHKVESLRSGFLS
ncbi:MAG: PilZ domain-containing protein [Desulfobacterales bacterium]|nr:PilZ domain-containing protein [Desulfobacterales bacterium]